MKIFKEYDEALARSINNYQSPEAVFRIINNLKITYFDKLRTQLESTERLYILVGRRIGSDQPLQSILTSFDRVRLEELKIDYLDTFDSLYIEECMFV
jgi:hypothetical protein